MKKTDSTPFILGITGSIGSGKSAVGRYLTSLGITVIDTDKLVHRLLSEDMATKKAIVEQFGEKVLGGEITAKTGLESSCSGAWSNHEIDRKKLGQIVFASEESRRKLEQIVHPNTILALRREVENLKDERLVAVQVPLLFESNLQGEYDQVWTVYTAEPILRERLKARDHLSDAEIDSRLAAQLPQDSKVKAADQVIDNSFSEAETERQVKLLVEKILPSKV
ncbi:MAG: dephospho-CoA kinase [Cyanobacteria bacterium REEB67]|nr:dephospho-CoA kinase [Cyanobacteria bacterium REEB67]